uniref:PBZ-type domain-containing protein n=1 Tax=Anopheles culicifacies TaxID=139723 RepID=A0A182MN70_9DIPT
MENQNSTLENAIQSKRKHDARDAEDTSKKQRVLEEDNCEEPSTSSQYLPANRSADPAETNSPAAEAAPAVFIKPDPDLLATSGNIPQVQIKPDPDALSQNTASSINDPGTSSKISSGLPISIKPDPDSTGSKAGIIHPGVVNPAVLRPSCDYGIRCYRAGQDHRNAYAHPGDLDYRRPNLPPPPPGSPMCPFGARCYRRNPQHFREYDHPDPNADVALRPRRHRLPPWIDEFDVSDEDYPFDSDPDFDATSSDEYFPGLDEENDDVSSEGDDNNDSGLDC